MRFLEIEIKNYDLFEKLKIIKLKIVIIT